MRNFKNVFVVLAALLLAGCSAFEKHDTSQDFAASEQHIAPLVVPSNLHSSKLENYYPIPKLTASQERLQTNVSFLPPGSSLTKTVPQQKSINTKAKLVTKKQ